MSSKDSPQKLTTHRVREAQGEHPAEQKMWLVAHLLFRGELDDSTTDFPVKESIVLLRVGSYEDAYVEADRIGMSQDGLQADFPQGDGRLRYVGLRKLSRVEGHLQHAVELTTLSLEVDNEDDIDGLMHNDFVKTVFEW